MPYLAVAEQRSIYYEYNRGSRLPILMIHGWGMSCRVWDSTVVALRQAGHGVVCFDQRGCGESDKDFAEVSIEASAGDAVALLDHLAIPRAVINGWSLGGAIAAETASRLGPRCAGLVLTTAATPRYTQAADFPHGNPPGSTAETVKLLRENRAAFLMGLTQAVCAVPQPEAVIHWMWSLFMQTSPNADEALAQLDTLDQRPLLAALRVPVLAMVGGKDQIVPPDICRLGAQIAPQGRLVEFAECGHAPFVEDGPRYRRELLDFVAGLA